MMIHLTRRRLLSLSSLLLAAPLARPALADGPRQIAWSELVPQDGDSMKALRGIDLSALQDDDPRANELLMKMREAADNAPANPALANNAIRIAGFIVPLEENGGEITEFLLVPYFGACIHTPPPPANQIIHVNAPPASKGWRSMDLVWITGTLRISRADTMMGVSGYQMRAETMTRATPASAK